MGIRAKVEQCWGEAIYRMDGRERESLAHFSEAARLGSGSNAEALALLSIAGVHQMYREVEPTLEAYRRSAALFMALGDHYGEFLARDSLQECLRSVQRLSEAVPQLARAVECALESGDTSEGVERMFTLGKLLIELDRPAEGLPVVRAAVGGFHDLGDARMELTARMFLDSQDGGKGRGENWARIIELGLPAMADDPALEAFGHELLAAFMDEAALDQSADD